ncbi:Alpha/Beta hydrolase protein [Multifurca ochricompacta]|uniref:Alpha/Beta hydrolase protein n=1 Tax=Multifurca ochricompacta TaxID=376703 RepID=A0AAD4QLA5_9AGAM|nr:Alpha/Beta hydrolase protein [Multifurca ochricompacta]
MPQVELNNITVDGVNVFYRSAGSPTAPVLLLLHGFPTSSFQFRQLIPLLAPKFRILAPDLPGFGFTEVPAELKYQFTFDNLSLTIEAFLDALKVDKFAVYIFDYGSPTAFRIAVRHPNRVTAIITQNGNAYEEGLGKDFWKSIKNYWASSSEFTTSSPEAQALVPFLQLGPTKWQYTNGVPEHLLSRIAPETYTLDAALLSREGQTESNLSLFFDYRTNIDSYPRWQEYLRTSGVPVLALWGQNDVIFIKAGAEAFARDVKEKDFVLDYVDSGHFPLETHVEHYAEKIDQFLSARILKA